MSTFQGYTNEAIWGTIVLWTFFVIVFSNLIAYVLFYKHDIDKYREDADTSRLSCGYTSLRYKNLEKTASNNMCSGIFQVYQKLQQTRPELTIEDLPVLQSNGKRRIYLRKRHADKTTQS